ncbi:MAG: glycosyltransferase [Planctomycetota bacterium]
MSSAPLAEVRVLHLLPHQGVGGLQRAVIDLVRHERMDGATDELVLTERPLDVDKDFMAPATPVHFLMDPAEKLALRAQRLADLAASRGARSLHAYRTSDLLLAAAARRRSSGLRVVATLFDRPPALSFVERRRLRRALQEADAVFVPSPALQAPWAALGREPEVRLAAVDIQRFYPQEARSTWRATRLPVPDTLLVGTLMSATPDKGQDVLAEAALRRHADGRPTALLMVGDGPRLPELRERARNSDVLHVRRRVLDAPSFFARIDVFALQSENELVPISLLESLACGRPAVVADRGDVEQLVGSDVARFVPPGDVDAVIAALDDLEDAQRRADMGFIARKRAVERHALGRLRGELAATYA